MQILATRIQWLRLTWWLTALLIWLGLGWTGHRLVDWYWRSAQAGEFEQTVSAVAKLAGQQAWKQPWESDPAWRALERELKVDLVPLTDGGEQEVAWVTTPSGHYRASVTVPLSSPLFGARSIRGTRTFHDQGIGSVWWLVWSAANLLWVVAVVLMRRSQARRLSDERAELAAWSQPQLDAIPPNTPPALQSPTSLLQELREGVLLVDQLCRIQIINSTLCEQLDINPSDTLTGKPLLGSRFVFRR